MILRWSAKQPRHKFTWLAQNKETLANAQDRGAEAVVAVVGARGQRGLSGSTTIRVTLAQAIGGHKAITFTGAPVTPQTLNQYAGVSTRSGVVGEELELHRIGLLNDPSFNFVAGNAVFLGANGTLVQTASPPLRRIGLALTATQVQLDAMPTIGA